MHGFLSARICICMYVYVYVCLPRMCALRDCEGALVDAYTITIITSGCTIARALRCVCVCMGIGMGMYVHGSVVGRRAHAYARVRVGVYSRDCAYERMGVRVHEGATAPSVCAVARLLDCVCALVSMCTRSCAAMRARGQGCAWSCRCTHHVVVQ